MGPGWQEVLWELGRHVFQGRGDFILTGLWAIMSVLLSREASEFVRVGRRQQVGRARRLGSGPEEHCKPC